MIPDFNEDGNLPAGIHQASFPEIEARFGFNPKRKWLLDGLKLLIRNLEHANCTLIYLDGSFVTNKEHPGDYDLCWSVNGVDPEKLDKALLDFSTEGRQKMSDKYRADIFPAEFPEGASGKRFLDFFQTDKNTGEAKGIIELAIGGGHD